MTLEGWGADIYGKKPPWLNNWIQFRQYGNSRGGEGRAPKPGHNYAQDGPIDKSVCQFSESEIHDLLSARMECRRKRDFQRADSIREQLKRGGVEVDDSARLWRADGKPFILSRNGAHEKSTGICKHSGL